MKLLLMGLISAVLLVGGCTRDMTVEEVVAQAGPSVVEVLKDGSLSGTGFIIDAQGLIVTNYHVIRNAKQVTIRLKNGTETYPVLGVVDFSYDDTGSPDFAILKIDPPTDLSVLPLGDDHHLKAGEKIVTIGHPDGYEYTPSSGDFSGFRQEDSVAYLQITAPIWHGNSGGPLLNLRGEVVGINTWGRDHGNLNFALSIQYIKDAVAEHGHAIRYTFEQLLAWQQTHDARLQAAENERVRTVLAQYFSPYEHPQKLFKMAYPKDWTIAEDSGWRDSNDLDSNYVQSSVFAPAGGYNTGKGYLKEGIRVTFHRPPSGHWTEVDNWPGLFKKRILNTNSDFRFGEKTTADLGNRPGWLYEATGLNDNVSEMEQDWFLLSAEPNYLLSVEFTCPRSKKQEYEKIFRIIQNSFEFGIDRGVAQ